MILFGHELTWPSESHDSFCNAAVCATGLVPPFEWVWMRELVPEVGTEVKLEGQTVGRHDCCMQVSPSNIAPSVMAQQRGQTHARQGFGCGTEGSSTRERPHNRAEATAPPSPAT